jgi:hypothetical protein
VDFILTAIFAQLWAQMVSEFIWLIKFVIVIIGSVGEIFVLVVELLLIKYFLKS